MLIYQRVFFTNKHHFTNKPSEVLIRCGARMAGLFKSGAMGDPDVVAWLTGGSSWFFWWVASGNNHLDNHLMGFIMGFNGIWWDSMGLTVCELENGTNDCDSMGDSMGFYSDWMGDNHLDNHLMGLRMGFFCGICSNLMELMIVIQWDMNGIYPAWQWRLQFANWNMSHRNSWFTELKDGGSLLGMFTSIDPSCCVPWPAPQTSLSAGRGSLRHIFFMFATSKIWLVYGLYMAYDMGMWYIANSDSYWYSPQWFDDVLSNMDRKVDVQMAEIFG